MGPASTERSQQQPSQDTKGSGFYWYIMAFAGMVLLYALSVGPVSLYYVRNRNRPSNAIRTLYAPLGYIAHHCRAVDRFFAWYVQDVWLATEPARPASTNSPAAGP